MDQRRFWQPSRDQAEALARAAGVPNASDETLDYLASAIADALGGLHHALTIGADRVWFGTPRREPRAIRDDARKLAELLEQANLLAGRLAYDDMALPREVQQTIAHAGVAALNLRDRLDAEAKDRKRRVPDDINGFLWRLINIYEYAFDRVAGRSRDPDTGAATGPLLRFVRAVLGMAKARGTPVPPLTNAALDRRLERLLSGKLDPRELIIHTLWPPDD